MLRTQTHGEILPTTTTLVLITLLIISLVYECQSFTLNDIISRRPTVAPPLLHNYDHQWKRSAIPISYNPSRKYSTLVYADKQISSSLSQSTNCSGTKLECSNRRDDDDSTNNRKNKIFLDKQMTKKYQQSIHNLQNQKRYHKSLLHLITFPSLYPHENTSDATNNNTNTKKKMDHNIKYLLQWKKYALGDGGVYFDQRPKSLQSLNKYMCRCVLHRLVQEYDKLLQEQQQQQQQREKVSSLTSFQKYDCPGAEFQLNVECSVFSTCARFEVLLYIEETTTLHHDVKGDSQVKRNNEDEHDLPQSSSNNNISDNNSNLINTTIPSISYSSILPKIVAQCLTEQILSHRQRNRLSYVMHHYVPFWINFMDRPSRIYFPVSNLYDDIHDNNHQHSKQEKRNRNRSLLDRSLLGRRHRRRSQQEIATTTITTATKGTKQKLRTSLIETITNEMVQIESIENISLRLSKIASGLQDHQSFRPFSSRDAHVQSQIKGTAKVVVSGSVSASYCFDNQEDEGNDDGEIHTLTLIPCTDGSTTTFVDGDGNNILEEHDNNNIEPKSQQHHHHHQYTFKSGDGKIIKLLWDCALSAGKAARSVKVVPLLDNLRNIKTSSIHSSNDATSISRSSGTTATTTTTRCGERLIEPQMRNKEAIIYEEVAHSALQLAVMPTVRNCVSRYKLMVPVETFTTTTTTSSSKNSDDNFFNPKEQIITLRQDAKDFIEGTMNKDWNSSIEGRYMRQLLHQPTMDLRDGVNVDVKDTLIQIIDKMNQEPSLKKEKNLPLDQNEYDNMNKQFK